MSWEPLQGHLHCGMWIPLVHWAWILKFIYTVDIDPTLVSEETKQKLPDNIKLIEGDYNNIANLFPPAMLHCNLFHILGW